MKGECSANIGHYLGDRQKLAKRRKTDKNARRHACTNVPRDRMSLDNLFFLSVLRPATSPFQPCSASFSVKLLSPTLPHKVLSGTAAERNQSWLPQLHCIRSFLSFSFLSPAISFPRKHDPAPNKQKYQAATWKYIKNKRTWIELFLPFTLSPRSFLSLHANQLTWATTTGRGKGRASGHVRGAIAFRVCRTRARLSCSKPF